jgi:lysophospholipase L1-like esterase
MRKTRAALANVRAGVSNMKIACVGDSVTAGVGAQNGAGAAAQWVGAKALSWPTYLASMLNAAGTAASIDSVISDNSTVQHSGTVPSFDPRVTLGANWTISALNTAGGQMMGNSVGSLGAAAAETMTFTPANAFTDVDIYWYRHTSGGTWTADIGGGVLATMASGALGLQKTTITGLSNTTHTLNLIRTVLGNVYLLGVVCYNTNTKSVNLLNMGWSGARSTTWSPAVTLYDPMPTLGFYAPDLTIICLGINDWGNTLTAATTEAALTTIIAKARETGDVLLVTPPPSITSFATAANQLVTLTAIRSIASTLGVPLLEVNAQWIDYTTANIGVYYNTDGIHPFKSGQYDIANAISKFLLSA